jgi:hypothetical protein
VKEQTKNIMNGDLRQALRVMNFLRHASPPLRASQQDLLPHSTGAYSASRSR